MSDNQWVWEPVDNHTDIRCDCGDCDRCIMIDDGQMTIFDEVDGQEITAHLPGDYALCRRVPQQPQDKLSASIPTEAIRYLLERAWLTQAGRTDLIQQVNDWLGPEGSENE